jgi:hypothetical protein
VAGWRRANALGVEVGSFPGQQVRAPQSLRLPPTLLFAGGKGEGVEKGGKKWAGTTYVLKDLGMYNGTSLRILDTGRGPFIRYGSLNFAMPATWKVCVSVCVSVCVCVCMCVYVCVCSHSLPEVHTPNPTPQTLHPPPYNILHHTLRIGTKAVRGNI